MNYAAATTYKQEVKAVNARYMRDLIKRSRAAWAVTPAYLKRDVIRRLEDGAAIAAYGIREQGA